MILMQLDSSKSVKQGVKDTDTKGQHYVIDAYECDSTLLNQSETLKNMMLHALSELNLDVLLAYFHSYSPQGVTGIFAISSSHFSVHTWPEHDYAAFDFYSCSIEDALPILKKVLTCVKAKRASIYKITRGLDGHILSKQRLDQVTNQSSYIWDIKVLDEIKNGDHTILYEGNSEFHKILLAEAKDLRLYLDDELQFSSLDEKHYHEPLVLPAMELTKTRNCVLILGGGDGLALREVLKYRDVKHVDLVDIDQKVVHLAKNEQTFATANASSFEDQRVHVHIMDARDYVKKNMDTYGVIIMDFPDPFDIETSLLYTREFFYETSKLLAVDGIMVSQSGSPQETPSVFWSIGKTLNVAGLQTRPYYSVVPSYGGAWGFHLASRHKLPNKIKRISVPHEAMDSSIQHLFTLPDSLKSLNKEVIINTNHIPKLYELYQKELNQTL